MENDLETTGDLKFESRFGFTIQIDHLKRTCVVSKGGQVEAASGKHGIGKDQDIPFLLFIGRRFEMLIRTGEFVLANVKAGKIIIPYRMWPEKDPFNIQVGCGTMSDQFPVLVDHFETVRHFEMERGGGNYRYVFLDPDVSSYQRMTFKIKNPSLKMLILNPIKEESEPVEYADSNILTEEEVEAGLEVESVRSQNPVFQSRIFLRNRETEKVKQMLMDYVLSPEDILIIRAFVNHMLQDIEKNPEFSRIKGQLRILDELLRLHSLLTNADKTLFESELDKGLSASVAIDLMPIVEELRKRAASKEDEIVFWEWEYRIGKMTGMSTA